jgi:hypothetical protein
MKRRAAILLAAFALGAATACAGEPTKPPRVLPVSDVLADERIRIWNATNHEAVAFLTEKRVEYEALAEEAKESSGQSPESAAAEAASYMRAADRIQQYIDAVCALPDRRSADDQLSVLQDVADISHGLTSLTYSRPSSAASGVLPATYA